MNIITEQLALRHLPELQQWIGRKSGAITPNDIPQEIEQIPQWYERNAADETRLDCLILAYETPIGIAGLRRYGKISDSAELFVFLGEVGYNHIRTATYATLGMLDRAFRDFGLQNVSVTVYPRYVEYLESLERMGFIRREENSDAVIADIDREIYFGRKHLF